MINTKKTTSVLSRNKLSARYLPVVVIILAGLGLSIVAFAIVRDWENHRMQLEFKRIAEDRISTLKRGIESSFLILESLGAFYAGSREVERREFREFVKPLLIRHPGIQALEWIPRVPFSQREAYEKAAQSDGFPEFHITERKAQGEMVSAAQREEYFPVYYVEPYRGNELALGFDLASNPTRKEALDRSSDSGEMVASARITLVQETGGQFGFLLFLPIYRKGAATDSITNRRLHLEGFILGVFRIGDIVEKALTYLASEGIDIHLHDLSAPVNERFLYFHTSQTREKVEASSNIEEAGRMAELHFTFPLDMAGRKWSFLCTPTSDYIASQRKWQPWAVSSFLLLCTGLLVIYFSTNIRRRAQLSEANQNLQIEIKERRRAEEELRKAHSELEQRVEERTSELVKTNDKLKREIEERKRADESLCESEEKYRQLFATVSDAIMVFDGETKQFVDVNDAVLRLYDYSREDFLKLRQLDITAEPEKSRESLKQALSGELNRIPMRYHKKRDGTLFPVEISAGAFKLGNRRLIFGVVRDITERKQAEQEKIQLEKLSALGRLVGGIAHELNNPMTGMLNFIDYCLKYTSKDNKIYSVLEDTKYETERCCKIVGNLLTFSRMDKEDEEKYEKESVALVFDRVFKLLSYRIEKENILLTQEYSEETPEIWMKVSNIQQVFLNLIGNALDAVKKSEEKEIHVEISPNGKFVHVTITDSGCGVSPEDLQNIFDPFFTTKPPGQGTGLGLSVCRNIVKAHGGEIKCEGEVGVGTKFNVLLQIDRRA